MHFIPILVFLSIVKISVVCACGGPARFICFLKDCFSVTEDHWTWTTCTGDWYEDAEIEAIDGDELVLKHRYGVERLPIDLLSDKSRGLLIQTRQWADHLANQPEPLAQAA